MSLAERTSVIAEINSMHARTGIRPVMLLSYLGLPKSTWNEWHKRQDAETGHNHDTPKSNWLMPEETDAITAFCGRYKDRLRGYRYLAWLMVDRNVACVLDGFSRKILVWDLFPTMEGLNIEILVTRVKELYLESHARIIHDNGKPFTSREFLELVARLELKETSTSPFHPQSNGKIERMHRTFKTEEVRRDDYHGLIDAKKKMGGWVHGYNSERLAERREKMYNANKKRQAYWSNQQT